MTNDFRPAGGPTVQEAIASDSRSPARDHALIPHIRPAVVLLLLFTALTGIVYPLAITLVAQLAFPARANGSLIASNGKTVGSSLIGQPFASDRYFQPRPSATNAPDPKDPTKTIASPYNAANSGGSNLGPTSKVLHDRIAGDVARLTASTGTKLVPADSVTTSGSGLDPHISPAFAQLQVARVAKARNLPEDKVRQLVQIHIEAPFLGIFGEREINVLGLNLALDDLPAS
jgi:potassium-transporting ATPase KdpC subunit